MPDGPKQGATAAGPFFRDGDLICDRRRSGERWVAMFEDADTVDDASCDEIVDLLNKGTRFDLLLKAAKDAERAMAACPADYRAIRAGLRAAIALCAGGEKNDG